MTIDKSSFIKILFCLKIKIYKITGKVLDIFSNMLYNIIVRKRK